ncbi:S24 family peptidase [endosymbiont 'TC1' of Trimyema compressum]|uniref:S24 family peptidase n=1 Tax=endosymbiont 'TC1' of Trimyema compressum TaxID=243899 RepID=UPI003CCB956B
MPTFKILLPNTPIENQKDVLGYINVASNGDDYKNYFAMSVIKNSLEPRLKVGDIVIVRKASKTQIKNGDLVVFSAKGKRKQKLM